MKQAEISLNNAEFNYNEAKRKFEQSKVLFESGVISREELNSSEKNLNDIKNQMQLSQIQLDNANNSLADFDINLKEQIADQRNQIEAAKADIANVQDKISKSEIKANISGKIVNLDVKENQYPTSENNSIMIYDLSQYKITVEANQYDAVRINQGQKASIKVKGIEGEYAGTVSKIDKAANVKTDWANKKAKVKVEITVDNPDDKIKAGYEADAVITLTEIPNTFAVNLKALKQESGKQFIFIIENGRAVKKYVKTGFKTDYSVQIIEGLKVGDQYIKNPPKDLEDGDPIGMVNGQ